MTTPATTTPATTTVVTATTTVTVTGTPTVTATAMVRAAMPAAAGGTTNKNRTGDGTQPGDGAQPGERQEPRERNDRPERNDRAPRPDRQDRQDRGERSEGSDQFSLEPVQVAGYLDLREEGYGFLRVNGYLASRDDAYIPVKLTRQYGLRKGDHVTGLSRPAGRNEKNPALLEIHTVNDKDPELAKNRRRFEDLTALFPDQKLVLSTQNDPHNMTVRIIELVSPIGKGQRHHRVAAQGR